MVGLGGIGEDFDHEFGILDRGLFWIVEIQFRRIADDARIGIKIIRPIRYSQTYLAIEGIALFTSWQSEHSSVEVHIYSAVPLGIRTLGNNSSLVEFMSYFGEFFAQQVF